MIRLFLITMIVVACASNKTTIRRSENFTGISSDTVLLLPPEGRVFETDFSGNHKRLYDFEYNIEHIIADKVQEVLQEKGILVKLLTRKLAHEQDANQSIQLLEDNYEAIDKKLYKESLLSPELAFSINETTNPVGKILGEKNNAQLLLKVSYNRYIPSSSSKAASLMIMLVSGALGANTGSAPQDVASLKAVIIEAATGKVLWANYQGKIDASFLSRDNKKVEEQEIKKLVNSLFANLNQENSK
jgi:hypothetical protein